MAVTSIRPDEPRGSDAIAFVLGLGRALHRYGTPAHRLEEALLDCCGRLGLSAEVFTTPTTILMSFGDQVDLKTRMMRVDEGELDMNKLARVDALADAVASQRLAPAEGVRELAAILTAPRQFGRVVSALGYAMSVGALAVFFGGSLPDIAVAAAIGLVVGVLARSLLDRRTLAGVESVFAMFVVAIAIVAGLLIANAVVSPRRR
ncbi:MAG TPA: threonine/serine exporter family protein [Kofleriaceae bacterium]|nr:threonine/serine exporter family protein [Kofleriaceae bacterium]